MEFDWHIKGLNDASINKIVDENRDRLLKDLQNDIDLYRFKRKTELLEKALNKACEIIADYNKSPALVCGGCPFYDKNHIYACNRVKENPDGTFDCDSAEWWKKALIEEVNNND